MVGSEQGIVGLGRTAHQGSIDAPHWAYVVAAMIDGDIHVQDETVGVEGRHDTHAVYVESRGVEHTLQLEIELESAQPIEHELRISYGEDGTEYAERMAEGERYPDGWPPPRRAFLSPHVGLDGDSASVVEMKRSWDRLPKKVRERTASFFERMEAGCLQVGQEKVVIGLPANMLLAPAEELEGVIRETLDVMLMLADAIENHRA